MDDREVAERIARVEELLAAVEEDTAALEAVAAVVELYGEALRRILERVDAGEPLDTDELVSHLLLVHDLHPVSLEARIRDALEEVRPYLGSHGGGVELLGVEGGVARLRLQGSCDGCPSSSATLQLAIEDAIRKAAPDIEAIEAEGVAEPKPSLLQIGSFGQTAGGNGDGSAWTTVGALPQLASGAVLAKDVEGEQLLFVRVDATDYAYRDACAACSRPLESPSVEGGELVCGRCGHRYDVRRAGRCLDEPELYLEPVPLLTTESGLVRVAVPAPA